MIGRITRAPALAGPYRRAFWLLVALGTAIRLVIAFTSRGVDFDIDSYELVRDALADDPFGLYAAVNEPDAPHWPYPSGFFAWLLVSGWASDLPGLRFDGFVQVAAIAADAALAWVVQAMLGQRGASDRTRLAAAALVAVGPSFAIISGYHGQLDAVAALPALLAVWAWLRLDGPQRALVAGALAGAGGSVKISALVVVLALLPTARTLREAATVAVTAAAVPLLLLVPWLAADASGTVAALRENDGLPGFGGISLLVQPELAQLWLRTGEVTLSSATEWLLDRASLIAVLALLATGALALSRRLEPVAAAGLLYLAFYALGVNFALQYLVWGLPFFLAGGHVRAVAALQAVLLVPSLLLYGAGSRDLPLEAVYTPILLGVWAAALVVYVAAVRRVARLPAQRLTPMRPV